MTNEEVTALATELRDMSKWMSTMNTRVLVSSADALESLSRDLAAAKEMLTKYELTLTRIAAAECLDDHDCSGYLCPQREARAALGAKDKGHDPQP